jgi:Mg-chelatase subunit ChlD
MLTDGAGNVSMSELPPQEEANRLAEQIAGDEVRSVVINMEHMPSTRDWPKPGRLTCIRPALLSAR